MCEQNIVPKSANIVESRKWPMLGSKWSMFVGVQPMLESKRSIEGKGLNKTVRSGTKVDSRLDEIKNIL